MEALRVIGPAGKHTRGVRQAAEIMVSRDEKISKKKVNNREKRPRDILVGRKIIRRTTNYVKTKNQYPGIKMSDKR